MFEKLALRVVMIRAARKAEQAVNPQGQRQWQGIAGIGREMLLEQPIGLAAPPLDHQGSDVDMAAFARG